MTQTHAQLRERIARVTYDNLYGLIDDRKRVDLSEGIADAILALLPPPDAGLASLVGEIDAALNGANLLDGLPWKPIQSADDICPDAPNAVAELNACLLLVNNWPAIRAALTTGGWRSIDSAPKDGTKFIARRGDDVRTTWATDHYVKWPHQEGGPTYRKEWSYEALDAIMRWKPTHWMPLPEPPASKPDTGE